MYDKSIFILFVNIRNTHTQRLERVLQTCKHQISFQLSGNNCEGLNKCENFERLKNPLAVFSLA